jgi:hypothetical protein
LAGIDARSGHKTTGYRQGNEWNKIEQGFDRTESNGPAELSVGIVANRRNAFPAT